MNFGFWNVRASRLALDAERDIPTVAAAFARQHSLDLICLIECALPHEVLLKALAVHADYYSVASVDRFKVFCRFNPVYLERMQLPVDNDRYDVWRLSLPLFSEILISAVHGLDKFYNSESKQEMFLKQVVNTLGYFERANNHTRTVIFGDFNANPFESPVAGALGLHGVSSRRIAREGSRQMMNETFHYFYNPMWNLFGDEPATSPPATYYFRGSDPQELFWHMLDQVLLRPSLIDAFKVSSLEIVSRIGGYDLLTSAGRPHKAHYSDHLPVVFELDLTKLTQTGDIDAERSLA